MGCYGLGYACVPQCRVQAHGGQEEGCVQLKERQRRRPPAWAAGPLVWPEKITRKWDRLGWDTCMQGVGGRLRLSGAPDMVPGTHARGVRPNSSSREISAALETGQRRKGVESLEREEASPAGAGPRFKGFRNTPPRTRLANIAGQATPSRRTPCPRPLGPRSTRPRGFFEEVLSGPPPGLGCRLWQGRQGRVCGFGT